MFSCAAVVPSWARQQLSKYAGVEPLAGVVSLYAINSVPMVINPAVGTFTNDVMGMVVAVAEVVACTVPGNTLEFPVKRCTQTWIGRAWINLFGMVAYVGMLIRVIVRSA